MCEAGLVVSGYKELSLAFAHRPSNTKSSCLLLTSFIDGPYFLSWEERALYTKTWTSLQPFAMC